MGRCPLPASGVVRRVTLPFRDCGYRVSLTRETGEHVLVATERSTAIDGVPWLGAVLFLATVGATFLAGVGWYGDTADAGLAELLGARGLFAPLVGRGGTATPLSEDPVGRGRTALGVLAFVFGGLCLTPVPVTLVC